jgi:hypothetical protein
MMTDVPRLPNGRFPPGVSGGRNGGRKPKPRTADEALAAAFDETVTINEGGRRKRVDKRSATAKHIANEGATGKNARAAYAALRKSEETRAAAPVEQALTESDEAIVARFLARLALTEKKETDDDQAVA